jgi:hypothetical protein
MLCNFKIFVLGQKIRFLEYDSFHMWGRTFAIVSSTITASATIHDQSLDSVAVVGGFLHGLGRWSDAYETRSLSETPIMQWGRLTPAHDCRDSDPCSQGTPRVSTLKMLIQCLARWNCSLILWLMLAVWAMFPVIASRVLSGGGRRVVDNGAFFFPFLLVIATGFYLWALVILIRLWLLMELL